jgi:hypothetical protein
MCHHPNSHTHRPCTHVKNTATYDTNSQAQRHKSLAATSSSKKLSHSVKQSLVLSSSTYVFGSLVARCGESGSVRFGGSNTTNAPHTGYVPLFFHTCLRKTFTNHTQWCPKNEYVSTEHVTLAVSEVLSSAVFSRTLH